MLGSWRLSWHELRVFILALGPDSALFRARHPKSWSWDVNTEFLAAMLFTLQGANWQRSGGRGDRPKFIKRPSDKPELVDPAADIDAKKKALDDEISRRREARDSRRKRRSRIIDRTPIKKEAPPQQAEPNEIVLREHPRKGTR